MAQDVTLHTVLEHIQGLRNSLEGRMDRLEGRMGGIEGRMGGIEQRVDQLENDLKNFKVNTNQAFQRINMKLDNHLEILTNIQITIVEQQHEKRIHRLEKFAGFAK
jgi:chromosome segregation ATPase